MNETITSAVIASVFSFGVSATEVPVIAGDSPQQATQSQQKTTINPSDLTAVNSFTSLNTDNEGKITGMLGIAGQYSKGNNFLGLIEHGVGTRSEGQGKQDSRLRYFQVLDSYQLYQATLDLNHSISPIHVIKIQGAKRLCPLLIS